MTTHKTVFDSDFQIVTTDLEFEYQTDLTVRLDNTNRNFDQEIINEIVLWKVNRYAMVDDETLGLLNDIDTNSAEINIDQTKTVLKTLIQKKGIQLPMASTILRFKNKNIYQIIDQRVFRIIYKDKKLKFKTYQNEKNLNEQIDLYIQYLQDLAKICDSLKIPFDKSDRILYMADKRINKDISIDNY
jgi:hypothetical protein